MGYNLHITRAELHSENEGCWISPEEWLQIVEEDPELCLAGYNGPHFALWTGPSGAPDRWLDWFQGNIYTKNPDKPTIAKMIEIAKKLDAQVQGDEGEIYTGEDRDGPQPAPDPRPEPQPPGPRSRKPWWRRLLRGA